MKIALNITVDIDPDQWVQYVSMDTSMNARELREDVRAYFLNLIQMSSALDDASGTAEIVDPR